MFLFRLYYLKFKFYTTLLACVSLILLATSQINGATVTYDITASDLVNMPNNCGTAGPYSDCSPNLQLGFNWTDGLPAGTVVTGVQIQFRIGVDCSAGAKTWRLNNVVQGTTNTSGTCSCSITGTPVSTVNGNSGNYNVGALNSFRLTTSSSCLGLYPHWSGGIYGKVTITYSCPTGWDIGTNPTTPETLQNNCNWRNIPLGSGSYENITIPANTWIDFDAPSLTGQFNQMRITPLNGSGNDGTFTLNSNGTRNAWYSGSTTSIRASARRNNCWSNTSAVLKYRKTTPSGNVTVAPATTCTGGTATFTLNNLDHGNLDYFQYRWNGTGSYSGNWGTSNPKVWSTHTSGGSSLQSRARLTNGGCIAYTNGATHNITSDPTTPSITKSPNVSTVCVGTALSVTGSGSTGGTGTCVYQYRRRVNGGNWTGWSSTNTYTAAAGNTLVEMQTRRNCNGSGCDDPASSVVSWNVDGTAPTNHGVTVSDNCWVTNNSNTYTITASATDDGTGVREIRVLINYQGTNSGTAHRGGYLGWRIDSHIWSADQVTATGFGGYASKVVSGTDYGQNHITLVSASSTKVGNTVTVNFVVRPTADFPQGCNWHDISMWSRDISCNTVNGWDNSDLNFSSMQRPSTPTASASTICGGTAVTLTRGNAPTNGITYYWQTSPSGTSTAHSGATYSPSPTSTTTYYLRPYCSSGCWGQASPGVTVNVQNNGTAVGTWVGNYSTDWADCRNWGGGVVPNGVNVNIVNGSPHNPIISSSVPNVLSIYVQSGADLRVVSGGSITTTAANFAGAGIRNNGYFRVENGATVNINSSGLRQYGNANFVMTGGTVTMAGWLYNNDNQTSVQMNISGGTLNVNRIPNYAGVINHSGGTINNYGYYFDHDATNGGIYNGSGTAVINFRGTGSGAYFRLYRPQTAFNDVNIYGSYTINASAVGLNVDGDFHIQSGGAITGSASYPFYMAGNWTNSGTFTNNNNSVYFDGAGAQAINAGGTGAAKQFYNVYITNSGTVTLNSNMEVDHTFDVQGGTFTMTNQNLYTVNGVSGGVSRIGAGATVIVNGASAQWRCSAGNNGATHIYGQLILNDGLVHSGANMTLHTSGTINQLGGRFGSGDTFRVDGDYNGDGGTLQVYGGGDLWAPQLYVTNAAAYFHNLEAADNGNRSNINGASQTIVVNNNFTINSGTNLDANGVNIEVGGDWINNGNIEGSVLGFTAAGNTVSFTGSGTITGASATTFHNAINTNGTRIQTVDAYVLNEMSVSTGEYRINGGNALTFSNGSVATISNGATFRVNGSSGNLVNVGVSSGSYTFTVNGAMRAKYGVFSGMGGNGIDLSASTASLPTASEDFDNCTFSNWSSPQALLLRNNLGIAGSSMAFINPGGINISHVTPAASNALVNVTGSANGSRWGEAYDGEAEGATFSRINWADTYTLTIAGSDFGGGSPADGTYYYGNEPGNNAPSTSVTSVSGSCGTGYTGTGSAPSGTGNISPAFSITQNSTITWNWDTPATAMTWTGNVDDNWHNQVNWSCYGIPGASTVVTLNPANLTGVGAHPVIYDDMVGECLNIHIVSGITVEIANDIGSGNPAPNATRLVVHTP